MLTDLNEQVRALFDEAGVSLTDEDWAWFERLREAVVDANRRMNLTRLVEPLDFYRKHVLDSLLPFHAVPELAALRGPLLAADVGAGAGFPGFVLARMRPDWDVALIERTEKKAGFLEDTLQALELGNAYVVPFDAREAPRHARVLRHGCALVVARAVGRIAPVTEISAPLLAPRGILVHYKGGAPDAAELKDGARAAHRLKLRQGEPVAYDLPPDARRSVVLTVNPPRRRKRGGPRRRT